MGFAPKSSSILGCPTPGRAGELLGDRLPISEHILEVVTPNRPDCLSIRGLAREISAITEVDFDEDLSITYPCSSRSVDEDIAIEVWDSDFVPALRRSGGTGRDYRRFAPLAEGPHYARRHASGE